MKKKKKKDKKIETGASSPSWHHFSPSEIFFMYCQTYLPGG